ncbi:hypothetical protein AG1IA_01774 [Rhizoctonia solani AG-1 IA]|uniref:Uncharacterized protein n=1 Tax=Thanatephorus cucumeris (strain AG1-IA) TaxID=983506 RepID=L8X501_THACA|nr:hypothetical protein AG1IA_01774 [Rhizoctonia solani AG-1 IA]
MAGCQSRKTPWEVNRTRIVRYETGIVWVEAALRGGEGCVSGCSDSPASLEDFNCCFFGPLRKVLRSTRRCCPRGVLVKDIQLETLVSPSSLDTVQVFNLSKMPSRMCGDQIDSSCSCDGVVELANTCGTCPSRIT